MRTITRIRKEKNDQTIIKVLFESPISKEKRTFIKWNYRRSIKKIKDIQIYDDVYIQIDNQIYTAWVMQKNINSIIIGYTIGEDFKEYTFNIRGMWNKTQIIQDNKMLILNK